MLDKPQIVRTEAQLTAVIRLTIPRAEIQTVMGPAIAEVMAAVAAQGLGPAGPVEGRATTPVSEGRQDQIDKGSIARSPNGGSAAGSLVTRPARAYCASASA